MNGCELNTKISSQYKLSTFDGLVTERKQIKIKLKKKEERMGGEEGKDLRLIGI